MHVVGKDIVECPPLFGALPLSLIALHGCPEVRRAPHAARADGLISYTLAQLLVSLYELNNNNYNNNNEYYIHELLIVPVNHNNNNDNNNDDNSGLRIRPQRGRPGALATAPARQSKVLRLTR